MARMTTQECKARGYALQEAADHLLMAWTDQPDEIKQGNKVSDQLRREAKRWFTKASNIGGE